MATIRLALQVPGYSAGLATNQLELIKTKRDVVFHRIAELMEGVVGGGYRTTSGLATPSLVLQIDDNTTAASGHIVFGTVANNSTINLAGITLTGKTASPSGNAQFLCGVSATADAAACAAIINAHPTLSLWVSASAASGTLTLTAIGPALGLIGNGLILSSSDGTNLACTAFASGAADSSAQTYSF